MEENKKLLYCILGSSILALLNNPIFEYSGFGIFQGGYGTSQFGRVLFKSINILSLIGFLLIALFSIILIIRNINFKHK